MMGVSISTLQKLVKKGEIFPEARCERGGGMSVMVEMFDADDVREVGEALYPKPDPTKYVNQKEAMRLLGVKLEALRKYNDELKPKMYFVEGKYHVYYPFAKLREIRERRAEAARIPKGYAYYGDVAYEMDTTPGSLLKYARINKLPEYRHPVTHKTYFPKHALLFLRDQIEYGKQYNQKGGTHR